MTKPDNIPRDVLDTATRSLYAAFDDLEARAGKGSFITTGMWDVLISAAARAIMAEREACAQVAANYFVGRPFPVTNDQVAAAIRNRGKTR